MTDVIPSPERDRAVIVGAGLAGLVAAERLAHHGVTTLVIERAGHVGGRLSTRQIGRAVADVGAQFFTVRSEAFADAVAQWGADGAVGEWCRGFDETDGYPRYRGERGMSELARYLADRARSAGAEIVTGVATTSIIGDGHGLTVTHDHWSREPDEADAVLLTAPVPESLALVAAGGLGLTEPGLRGIAYHRVLALAATTSTDNALALPATGATQSPSNDTFSFIADNQVKGISPARALTFHTAHRRSEDLWDLSDTDVTAVLVEAAAEAVGLTPDAFDDVRLRRWRFTGPHQPWPDRTVVAARAPGGAPVILAGDAFGGPKVEGAFLSGLAAADSALSELSDDGAPDSASDPDEDSRRQQRGPDLPGSSA